MGDVDFVISLGILFHFLYIINKELLKTMLLLESKGITGLSLSANPPAGRPSSAGRAQSRPPG